MANVKLTELTAYTSPVSTDVLPIVDLVNNQTKKVTVADLLKRFGAGTASAPSFSFSGDIDTGIYSPGANQFAVTTGGTQRLLIDASGNTTIQGDLTVNGTTTTVESNTLSIKDKNIEIAVVSTPTDTTADGGGITLKGASDKTINWVQSTGCWTLNQPTNFNNHVRIDSNGLVGIGTDSPGSYNASADNLVIQNSGGTGSAGMTIRAGTGAQSTVYFADGTGASDAIRGYVQYFHNGDFLRFGTDANERLRIDSNGRLLLGTTTEGYATYADKLTIANAGHCGMTIRSGSSHNGSIYFSDATSGTSEYDGYIEYQHTDRRFLFGTATGSRMVIDSSGNLLVGLTSAVGISGTPADLNSTEIGRGYINISRDDTSAADHIQFGKNGSVASSIGTSTTNSLTFKTGTTERLRIDSSGSATFSGYVDFMRNAGDGFGYLGIGPGGTNEKATFVNRSGEIDFELYSNYTSSATVSINSEGSAMFAGNVGIGTTSPAAPLHVKSTAVSQLIVERDGSGTQIGAIIIKDGSGDQNRISSTDSNLVFGYGSSNTEAMRIGSAGQIGLGGANYGTSGQVLTSGGASGAVSWADASSGSSAVIVDGGNFANGSSTVSTSSTIDGGSF